MPRLPLHLALPCLLLTACGQTGNLYLPDHGIPPSEKGHKIKTQTPPAATPAPSASTDAPPGSTPESFDEKKKEKRDAAAAKAAPPASPAPDAPVTPAQPATTP